MFAKIGISWRRPSVYVLYILLPACVNLYVNITGKAVFGNLINALFRTSGVFLSPSSVLLAVTHCKLSTCLQPEIFLWFKWFSQFFFWNWTWQSWKNRLMRKRNLWCENKEIILIWSFSALISTFNIIFAQLHLIYKLHLRIETFKSQVERFSFHQSRVSKSLN